MGNLGNPKAAGERRRRYAELRNSGADSWDAAVQIGVDPFNTAKRYERWYQASRAPAVPSGEGGTAGKAAS